MTNSNITWYLKNEMKKLHMAISTKECAIRGAEQRIDDMHKEIKSLKVHYLSLLNTAIAYGDFDKEEFESSL